MAWKRKSGGARGPTQTEKGRVGGEKSLSRVWETRCKVKCQVLIWDGCSSQSRCTLLERFGKWAEVEYKI